MSLRAGMSFLYNFDLGNRDSINPGSNILSVTSTAPGDFDKANLTTESLRHVWRSVDVATWQEIVIKAEAISNIDTFGILGHNFSDSAVVQVQANIADNWIAPPVTITIPWVRGNMVHTGEFGGSYEYYRVRVLDPANTCGFIEIGRIVGGQALIMLNDEDVTDDFSIAHNDMSDVLKNEGFFRVSNEKVQTKTLKVRFSKLNTLAGMDDNFQGLRDMYRVVGVSKPMLAILDRGDPGFLSVWSQLDDLPSESYTVNRFVSVSLSMTEVF